MNYKEIKSFTKRLYIFEILKFYISKINKDHQIYLIYYIIVLKFPNLSKCQTLGLKSLISNTIMYKAHNCKSTIYVDQVIIFEETF